MIDRPNLPPSVGQLRRAFDDAFGAQPAEPSAGREDFLALRIGADAYAIRVRDISAFRAAGRIVPFPSSMPELLGLTAISGALVPVISLAGVLGRSRTPEPPRWLVLCDPADPLAFGFGEFEGYLRLFPSDLCAAEGSPANRRFVDSAVLGAGTVRSILNTSSLIEAIKGRASRTAGPNPQ